MSFADHLIYAAAWGIFGLLHSLTAGAGVRNGLGRIFGKGHRLAYNGLAVLELLAVLAVGGLVSGDAAPFHRPWPLVVVQVAMLVLGVFVAGAALRSYRAGPFIGWAQLRGEDDDVQPLVITGLHAWIRHPLYSAALLLLWGIIRNELHLATAIWASAYFYIGSLFEERRLVARYGDAYRDYRNRVPRFIPWRGRAAGGQSS